MTIHTIDILKMSSEDSSIATSELLKLCLYLGSRSLEFLSYTLMTKNPRCRQIVNEHRIAFRQHMSYIGNMVPGYLGIPDPINSVKVSVDRHFLNDSMNLRQNFTMNTLSSIHSSLLVDVLSLVLRGTLACIRARSPSLPEYLLSEWERKINEIIKDLIDIFPSLVHRHHSNFTAVILKIDFENQWSDVGDLCLMYKDLLHH
jgi:hypothetical protein